MKMNNENLISLSVVLPCHNEEEVIESSYNILIQLLNDWVGDVINEYEIVMVNNGSTDRTLYKMLDIQRNDKNVVIVDLRRNFGYQGSITAGLYNSTGDAIVSIDADLQDDPEKIREMIIKYNEGYELVLGVRSDRSTDNILKRVTAFWFYKFLNVLGIQSVSNHGDFRLMSKNLVNDLKLYPEKCRYLRGLIFQIESRYSCVYYKRTPRKAGKSKFKPFQLFSLAWDGITSLTNMPVRLVLIIGTVLFFSSIIGIIYVLWVKLVLLESVSGWASMLTLFLFFTGIQSLLLGLIGEYISKIFIEVKQRPIFLVRKKYVRK